MITLATRAAVHVAAVLAMYLSAAMTIPALVDFTSGNDDWRVFAYSAFFLGGFAAAVALATRGDQPQVTSRFGFALVNLLWLTTAVTGSVPFMVSSLSMSMSDGVFEAVSAITTTGSTVITGLDNLPPGLLLWRSMLQWIGGLGVLALGLFLLPFLRIGGVAYFKLESSDIEDKPFERFATFSTSLVSIYSILTLLCAISYAMAGMTAFNAVNHAMTTIATGGMSTHDASFGHYADNSSILWIATLFMFIGGLPFSILILFAIKGRFEALRDPQIRVYAAYCLGFAVAVAIYVRLGSDTSFFKALTHAAFNFVSVITTTGYASDDYSLWGPFAVACFFFATFLGGCSGSTAGGIKAYRFLLLAELLVNGLRRLIYPSMVSTIRYGTRTVDADMQRAVVIFIISFFFVLTLSTLLLAASGLDLVTSLSGALTALTNVGPGLGDIIGPAGNFATVPDSAKWILSAAMLLGRLEILVVLVIFTPTFWSS